MRFRPSVILILLVACSGGSPTEPRQPVLTDGRWAGDNACLDVHQTATTNLVVGCGHGQIPPIALRNDGTFDVDGTYRIEVGPVSPDPAPPAHYSGALANSTLTLTVTPSVVSLPRATYHLKLNPGAVCGPLCV